MASYQIGGSTTWPPPVNLPGYDGPYERSELERARSILIDTLCQPTDHVIKSIKHKIGAVNGFPCCDSTDTFSSKLNPQPVANTTKSKTKHSPISCKQSSTNTYHGLVYGELSDEDQNEPDAPYQCLKCDFCSYSCFSKAKAQNHLQTVGHYSASLYTVFSQNGKLVVVTVDEQLVVTNIHVRDKTVSVVCPECYIIFEDIFMCGVHCELTHGESQRYYSICPIKFEKIISFNRQPICSVCNAEFYNFNDLNKHWEVKGHFPCKKPEENSFLLCVCPYCPRKQRNFLSGISHVLTHKKGSSDNLAMIVRHIASPSEIEELPPFKEVMESNTLAVISQEITSLKKMRRHCNRVDQSHKDVQKRNIRKRLRYLKNQQAAYKHVY